jgi:hypothetical protein
MLKCGQQWNLKKSTRHCKRKTENPKASPATGTHSTIS